MMVSSILVASFVCMLAWSAEIAEVVSQKPEVVICDPLCCNVVLIWLQTHRLTVALVVFCIYAVDFSINVCKTISVCVT